jgi:hypothetical protein
MALVTHLFGRFARALREPCLDGRGPVVYEHLHLGEDVEDAPNRQVDGPQQGHVGGFDQHVRVVLQADHDPDSGPRFGQRLVCPSSTSSVFTDLAIDALGDDRIAALDQALPSVRSEITPGIEQRELNLSCRGLGTGRAASRQDAGAWGGSGLRRSRALT